MGASRTALLLAFALLCQLAHSQALPSTYIDVCSISQVGAGATDLIAIAFMFVTLLIAASYMYGSFMHNENFLVWSKDEAKNLFITALMFVGLAAFFTGSCNIALGFTGGQSPFDATNNYLNKLLYSNGEPLLRELVQSSLGNQADATPYLNLGFTPYFGHAAATSANLRALSANKELMIDMYLPLVASLSAQKQLLQIIQLVAASVLLPFAFVLRIIPQTREFGDMLLALFFGLYIVLPTFYAMSGAAFETVLTSPMAHIESGKPIYSFHDFAFDSRSPPLAMNKEPLFRLGSTLPQAVFMPNLAIIVLITCVMSLSKGLHAIQV
ncbi:MAG: hypothetical protein NTV88_05245 [Candidatus Micrarchaeota archaeon]|nr:hypothetical protein [Candidatus Micrarchaeota archaeon]